MEVARAEDKVYRCEHCNKPVIQDDIQKGGCICGSRRLTVATSLTDEEVAELEERGYVFDKRYWMDEQAAKQERGVERAV